MTSTNQEPRTKNQEPSKLPERQDEVLVKVQGVSKKFCRDLKKSLWYGVKDVAAELLPFGRKETRAGRHELEDPSEENSNNQEPRTKNQEHSPALRAGEFWANKDISFELRRGECLGLIGHNGAGKTTLLKMLNGLIKPDEGTIEMRGRVGALIALGAGFNPILSGRENVYVNGSILGLSKKEIDEKIEDIIDFAEIREFIDSPVQSYSSGMQVRLGFAVATALNPDVLILDEVLAVGDASFRHKCYHRINKLIKNCAVILVSHNMEQIATIASSVGMMNKGNFQHFTDVTEGINAYNTNNFVQEDSTTDGGNVFVYYPPIIYAGLKILKDEIEYGEALDIEINFELSEVMDDVRLTFTALNYAEQPVMTWTSTRHDKSISLPAGLSRVVLRISPMHLHEGVYHWCFGLIRMGSLEHTVYAMRAGKFSVKSNYPYVANIPYLPKATTFDIISL